ncbi:MAG: hypothetical protein OER88_11770, partial [Planctomycetota bacterium]|nr:hypothetical protein [Planctomycetota bacterium]
MRPAVTLRIFALAVVTALAAVFLPSAPHDDPKWVILLVSLAFFAGAKPMRFKRYKTALVATHPLILLSIFLLGPWPAVATSLAGVIGSTLLRGGWPSLERTLFNLVLGTASPLIASQVFLRLYRAESATDITFEALWLPSLLAAIALFLVNTLSVAWIVSGTRGESTFTIWREGHLWTAPGDLAGWTLSLAMVWGRDAYGWPALVLALPPCWLLLVFYADHRRAIEERDRRITEITALNRTLEETVERLESARQEVRMLRGLLPI